ncbi:MAG TPA: choice-of-anchor tandem repeat GloVer-containing protein [Candidatus Acidoferrales bacterium]|nr:choice-of-anchor tandem repeat GloVer-containing protein [Candidatus Acidoferrales bacterium]
MRSQRFVLAVTAGLVAIVCSPIMTTRAAAQTETVLHSFTGTDGVSPLLNLVFDSAGNLYGTAGEGGASNNGTVFELSPSGNGNWTEKTLLSFNGGSGGSTPVGGLVIDDAGNLYGTTKLGGANGVGIVFELSPSNSGSWTESVLHNFGAGKDGKFPTNKLTLDSHGNLFGTSEGGGAYGNGTENNGGTAFKVSQKSGGGWSETVIHSFGHGTDGAVPRANVVMDSAGNVYGTTVDGGSYGGGTVFEVMPQSAGGWKEKVLYSFNTTYNGNNTDGTYPWAGVIFDSNGNLYGTTSFGGADTGGTVYELSPQSSGSWSETILYDFDWLQYDTYPYAGLVFDTAGNLYGVDLGKIDFPGTYGTVFKLIPQSGTTWVEKQLYTFDGTHGAGAAVGSLIIDSSGNLYGATQNGGSNKDGVVFRITP